MKKVKAPGTYVAEDGTIVAQVPALGSKPGRVKVELSMNGHDFISAGSFELERLSGMSSPATTLDSAGPLGSQLGSPAPFDAAEE